MGAALRSALLLHFWVLLWNRWRVEREHQHADAPRGKWHLASASFLEMEYFLIQLYCTLGNEVRPISRACVPVRLDGMTLGLSTR